MSEMRDQIADENPDAVLWDGFDEAVIGIARRCGQPTLAVYDYERCVAVLMKQGLDFEEAVEYLEFNVVGGWVGEHTPVMLQRLEKDS